MSQSQTFAVIFDMDGVLVDSTMEIRIAFKKTFETLGFKLDPMSNPKYSGRSLADQVSLWKEDYGIDAGDPNVFSRKAFAFEKEMIATKSADLELRRLLIELKDKGVPMGVGTSSKGYRAEEILTMLGIRDFFAALVTADDVTEHKPNPHVFLEVARHLKTPPEKCVVIEDAATGVEAARNGCMKSIGFLTEWNSEEELSRADGVIRGFAELSYDGLASMLA
ncbi:MAG: HAD family phosphatase [Candidatus Pacebacteria bacterium]|nr:HAD family phosphatase [Candidatus Paceibacterota bacterium]